MKLAVFTDIHGNLQALNAILEDIKKKNVDKMICLGDNIGLGPNSTECVNKLNKQKDLIMIAGNHELYYTKGLDKGYVIKEGALEHNKWIHENIKCRIDDSLLKYEIKHNDKKLLFIHFFLSGKKYPFVSTDMFKSEDYKKIYDKHNYDYVFYGHRHKERIEEYNGNHYYGLLSSGCTKDDNTVYYLITLDKDIKVEKIVLKYDRKKFESILNSIDYPDKEHICDFFFGIKKC